MNIKNLLNYFLSFFDPLLIIPVLIEFLETEARKTETPVDDAIIAALKAAAIKIWPDLF